MNIYILFFFIDKHSSIRYDICHSISNLLFNQVYILIGIRNSFYPKYHEINYDLTINQIIYKTKSYFCKLHKPTTIPGMVRHYSHMGRSISVYLYFHNNTTLCNSSILKQRQDWCRCLNKITKQWQVLNLIISFDFL